MTNFIVWHTDKEIKMRTKINGFLNFDYLPVLAKNKNLASIQLKKN